MSDDRAWQTKDAERRGRRPASGEAVRLVRVLSYDDLTAGSGPSVDLVGPKTLRIGGGRPEGAVEAEGVVEVRVADEYMSQAHARLSIDAGSDIVLEDLGSRNGTRTADGPIPKGGRTVLRDGAWFETGHSLWIVRHVPLEGAPHVELGPTKSHSPVIAALVERASRLARSTVPLILSGPTGSGKEVLAQEVHRLSGRPGELVGVNCGAIASALVETELFGHLRGAFTGATEARRGYVEAAHRGTLFLDEISELPLAAQVRLLRALELGEVVPVGGVAPTKVDLRIVSASNRDLEALVDDGAFRPDLYSRLAGYVLVLPPLSARKEDLGELVGHFVRATRKDAVAIEPAAGRALIASDWPLNVRELRRAIEAALALALDRPIELDDLPASFAGSAAESEDALDADDERLKSELLAALRATDWNVTRAAERLGKHRQQVQRWMRRLGIERDRR